MYQLRSPDIPLLVLGDFNGALDPMIDRHPPPSWGPGTPEVHIKNLHRGGGLAGSLAPPQPNTMAVFLLLKNPLIPLPN